MGVIRKLLRGRIWTLQNDKDLSMFLCFLEWIKHHGVKARQVSNLVECLTNESSPLRHYSLHIEISVIIGIVKMLSWTPYFNLKKECIVLLMSPNTGFHTFDCFDRIRHENEPDTGHFVHIQRVIYFTNTILFLVSWIFICFFMQHSYFDLIARGWMSVLLM